VLSEISGTQYTAVSLTNTTSFPNTGMKARQGVTTEGLFLSPAKITRPNTTWEIAAFSNPSSSRTDTAGVINLTPNGNGTREQMIFFSAWNVTWSPASAFLQHAYINWMTRGLHAGYRRIHFSTQIDDVHMQTDLFEPAGKNFRIVGSDLAKHVSWTDDLNSRLPAGSRYVIELAHNGNGNLENATNPQSPGVCAGASLIFTDSRFIDAPYEFVKPPGSGTNAWPTSPTNFSASTSCIDRDNLLTWLQTDDHLDKFMHISHTYTHQELNNATYSDASKEISFNRAWLAATGISEASVYSGFGIVPPAITGLNNSDVIQAWLDNGIQYVVGDNTRPSTRNRQNLFWPLDSIPSTTSRQSVLIVPRWATTIFYNCDTTQCDLHEWARTRPNPDTLTFNDLLAEVKVVAVRNLLALHHDPFMFHQANLRTNVDPFDINGKRQAYSLLMAWTETVLQEIIRLTNWPVITKAHDELGTLFHERRARDQCGYKLTYLYASDNQRVSAVEVSANSNTCGSAIPITFPGPVTSTGTADVEQVSTSFSVV